jgi:glycosyltransferase involved in cell wall biosynthesis
MSVLRGRDILIFGEDWGRFPSTTQHIGKVLLRDNRVMWVGSLGHRKPRFSLADVRRVGEKIGRMVFGSSGSGGLGAKRNDSGSADRLAEISYGAAVETTAAASIAVDTSARAAVDKIDAGSTAKSTTSAHNTAMEKIDSGGKVLDTTGRDAVDKIDAGSTGMETTTADSPNQKSDNIRASSYRTTGVPYAAPESADPILVHPPWIPWHDSGIIRRLNRRSLVKRLTRALHEHEFRDVIVITSTPLIAEALPQLSVQSVHYLCLDDYSEFDDAFEALMPLERELLRRSDTCFAVSDILAETRRPHTGASFAITQGVDLEHFRKRDTLPPGPLKDIRGPVVGFFGLVSEWVDVDLIIHSAVAMPEVTFVVIGRATVDLSRFSKYPNIVYTGLVSYADLPMYASVFDVGSIPFRVNELTLACNPLKMFEYFSMGLPVVSTALPEVEKFVPDVMVARSRDEYVQMLEKALQQALEPGNAHHMRSIAARYSWEAITAFISGKIREAEHDLHAS